MAVRPSDILLPTNFNTAVTTTLKPSVKKVDALLPAGCIGSKSFTEITLAQALSIIDAIEPALVSDPGTDFDWSAMKGLLRYYAEKAQGRVLIYAEQGRRLSKEASGDRSGLSILGTKELRDMVRARSRKAPALVLLKQEGKGQGKGQGWKSGPFWWPMLASPPQANACVFATKSAV